MNISIQGQTIYQTKRWLRYIFGDNFMSIKLDTKERVFNIYIIEYEGIDNEFIREFQEYWDNQFIIHVLKKSR